MIRTRSATPADRDALGRFGAALMRMHHAADPARFIEVEQPEAGYGRYLVSVLDDPDTLVLVAEQGDAVVGYLYADVEDISWKDLRGPCGYVHDLYVDPAARGQGAGRALMAAALAWIRSQGRRQVVLSTQAGNVDAQALFARLGFRATMLEMTWDAADDTGARGEGG